MSQMDESPIDLDLKASPPKESYKFFYIIFSKFSPNIVEEKWVDNS